VLREFTRERPRRSSLISPGSDWVLLKKQTGSEADIVVLELEDAVHPSLKEKARKLVVKALGELDYGNREVQVRINGFGTPWMDDDIAMVVPQNPHMLKMPKAENEDDIKKVSELIERAESKAGLPIGCVKLMLNIESAWGVINVEKLALCDSRIVGLGIGSEDMMAALRAQRSRDGLELLYVQGKILMASRAAGLFCIDRVYPQVYDLEGLRHDTKISVQLGFDGKNVISPRQVPIVHEVYMPTEEEISSARRIIKTFEESTAANEAVCVVDGKMIDRPLYIQAKNVMLRSGQIDFN